MERNFIYKCSFTYKVMGTQCILMCVLGTKRKGYILKANIVMHLTELMCWADCALTALAAETKALWIAIKWDICHRFPQVGDKIRLLLVLCDDLLSGLA